MNSYMKNMNRKQKISYIMEYYGGKILLFGGGAAIIIFLAVNYFVQPSIALSIVAVNTISSDAAADHSVYYDTWLLEHGQDTKKVRVAVSSGLNVAPDENDAISQKNIEMITSKFMTNSADVLLADEEFLYSMGEMEYLADLTEYLPQELLEEYQDDLIYVKEYESQKTIVAGIRLKKNSWIHDSGWFEDQGVIGLCDCPKNKELAMQFLEDILQDKE